MLSHVDWDELRLIVFDVDGTLYDQRRLRLRMLAELLRASLGGASLEPILTLRQFRRTREALAASPGENFLEAQYELVAARRGLRAEDVRSLVAEWMYERPLPFLPACRRPGVESLFQSLRRAGKRIGIFSDYPAHDKLNALGLRADFLVSATDDDVARPKPDPTGLLKLMRAAQVEPRQTLMVGDRAERDWEAARCSNVGSIILAPRPIPGVPCFSGFHDPVFEPIRKSVAPVSNVRQTPICG
jgi:HAD superfamily hydrolase (TIGR01509 family)